MIPRRSWLPIQSLPDARSTELLRLPEDLRRRAEHFFAEDFSTVRVHVHPGLTRLGCRAAAHADRLYFAPGAYCPGSTAGAALCFHELTHCVQQRRGRATSPQEGSTVLLHDMALEAEADAMAALAQICSVGPLAATSPGVPPMRVFRPQVLQPVLTVGITKYTKYTDKLWQDVYDAAPGNIQNHVIACQSKLKHWVEDSDRRWMPWAQAQNKEFKDFEEVARALVGHLFHDDSEAREDELAKQVVASDTILRRLKQFVEEDLWPKHRDYFASFRLITNSTGRYAFFYSKVGANRNLLEGLDFVRGEAGILSANLKEIAAFLADYAYAFRDELKVYYQNLSANDARATHHNVNESNPWVQEARAKNVRLGAGPSATTGFVLALIEAVRVGKPDDELLYVYVALALFAFWNRKRYLLQMKSATHTFHEVMCPVLDRGIQPVSELTGRRGITPAPAPSSGAGGADTEDDLEDAWVDVGDAEHDDRFEYPPLSAIPP